MVRDEDEDEDEGPRHRLHRNAAPTPGHDTAPPPQPSPARPRAPGSRSGHPPAAAAAARPRAPGSRLRCVAHSRSRCSLAPAAVYPPSARTMATARRRDPWRPLLHKPRPLTPGEQVGEGGAERGVHCAAANCWPSLCTWTWTWTYSGR